MSAALYPVRKNWSVPAQVFVEQCGWSRAKSHMESFKPGTKVGDCQVASTIAPGIAAENSRCHSVSSALIM
jgi:hypothetical protein